MMFVNNILFLTRLAKTSTELGGGTGRKRLQGIGAGGGRSNRMGSYGTPVVILRSVRMERGR